MATNFVNNGLTVTYTNSTGSAITAGSVVVMSTGSDDGMLGIAHDDIANGASGPVYVEGVFTVPKVSGAVIKQGEYVIYDVSVSAFDDNQATPATGDISDSAWAVENAGSGVTTIAVKLCKPGAKA